MKPSAFSDLKIFKCLIGFHIANERLIVQPDLAPGKAKGMIVEYKQTGGRLEHL